jgi:hypothetical protein
MKLLSFSLDIVRAKLTNVKSEKVDRIQVIFSR